MASVLDEVTSGEDFGEPRTPEASAPAPQAPTPQAPAPAAVPAPASTPQTPAAAAPTPPDESIPGEFVRTGAEGQPQQRFVPHGAFHAEREANKQLRARLAELEQRQTPRLTPEELLAIQRQMQPVAPQPAAAQPTPPPEPPVPDFMADPKGYIDAMAQRNAKQLEAIRAENAKLTTQQEDFARQNQIRTTAQYAEMSFVKQTPDYYAALEYGRSARLAQLRLIYPQAPEIGLRQAIAGEELQLAAHAIQTGRNPAEIAYGYVRSLGYQPPTGAPAAQNPQVSQQPTPAMLAAQTLGASSAADPAASAANEPEDPNSEVHAALAEIFGVKRK